MRRVVLVLAAVVLGAAPAEAKMPRFEVEVLPESPVVDEPFQIVVNLEQAIPVDTLASLLQMHSAEPPPQIRNLVLTRTGETTYATTITVDEPGEWVIIAFPDRTGWSVDEVPEGYPDRIPITVSADPNTAGVVGGALALVALTLIMARFIAATIET